MRSGKIFGKLYLEGIEVPFTGATITSTVGQATIAYIDVIPHHSINHIKPRTMVHIAVHDYRNPDPDNLKLAFDGEVFGFNFNKTPTGRSVTLMAIDFSSYWDNVLTYFFNPQQSLGQVEAVENISYDLDTAKASGVTQNAITHSIASFYQSIMKETGGDMMDGVIGIYKKLGKINEFYQLATERLKITDRISMRSSGNLKELLDNKEGLEWFSGIAGQYSGFQTLRSVVNDFMSLVFHDFISVPFPAWQDKRISQFVFKPNMYMMPPPMCNVFYPDEYSSFTYNRNFLQEPTRLIYKPTMPMYQGSTRALHTAYAPKSFSEYMMKNSVKSSIGNKPTDAPRDFGNFGDDCSGELNKKKREQNFMTNEEYMKGILMSQETMMPAASQFSGSSLTTSAKKEIAHKIANYMFYKKRFQGRECSITSHLKMSVVPGFTALIVDEGDSDQNVIAYCNSVTHRIYSNQGGYTQVNLNYARTVSEQDDTSENKNEPLIPAWFSESIFGSGSKFSSKKMSEYYASLLGGNASKNILDYSNKSNNTEAAQAIIAEYKSAKKSKSIPELIQKATARSYTNVGSSFDFIGRERMLGSSSADKAQIQARRNVVIKYRDALNSSRGFRG